MEKPEFIKQVFQIGRTEKMSSGEQIFYLHEDGKNICYCFDEGNHVNVDEFVKERREEINQL